MKVRIVLPLLFFNFSCFKMATEFNPASYNGYYIIFLTVTKGGN